MQLSRRTLLRLALGSAQVALLERFGLATARARYRTDRPTKLLAIWLDGGLHYETFFCPLTRAGIEKFIPAPAGGLTPWGYQPRQVQNFDRSSADLDEPGPVRKIRGPIFWNWRDPADAGGVNPLSDGTQNYRPWGYSLADPEYRIFDRMSVLVGADQNTAAHASGIVASMCGVAGASFRAPAVQAVVANAMAAAFPDRALANVSLGGPLPVALGLPSFASPTVVPSLESVEPTLSDRRDASWLGLRSRREIPDAAFDGTSLPGTVPATVIDEATLSTVSALRGRSTAGTDALLEHLYDTYKGASRTIARDILSILGRTEGWTHLIQNPRYPTSWAACLGVADSCGSNGGMGPYDLALRLLKSDLVTSVTLRATSFGNNSFDTHFANGPQIHTNHLRIALEAVGRMLIEMALTPSRSNSAITLLDETLVYVFSDFGRTFPKQGSDHHPATCAILAGGGIAGNQMIGAYDETMDGSPMGLPVTLVEESGARVVRPPRSQDIAATVLRAFLEPGRDFFIPGGYGVFDGVIRS